MLNEVTSYTVSSVLNKDSKQFGKNFLFDNNDDTCWNSDQGSPQWMLVKLKHKRLVSSFTIQFQGGFAGKDCIFKSKLISGENLEMKFYPEDSNLLQTFTLNEPVQLQSFQFIFNSTTDFYGRVVIYRLSWE